MTCLKIRFRVCLDILICIYDQAEYLGEEIYIYITTHHSISLK
jgi:hypothetical protein